MAPKNIMLTFLVFLILQHNFDSIEASRNNIQITPTIPRSPQAPSVYWKKPNSDTIEGGSDAYRPTSPGHSPGVGHETPPQTK